MKRAVTLLAGLMLLFACVSKQDSDIIKENEIFFEEETIFLEEDLSEPDPVIFYEKDLVYKLWLRAANSYPFNVQGYYFLSKGRWLAIGNKVQKAGFWSLKDNVIWLSWFDSSLEKKISQNLQLSSLTEKSLTLKDDNDEELSYQYVKQDSLTGSWELIFAHGEPESTKKKVWIEFLPNQENNKGVLLGSTGINNFRLAYENKETWKMGSAIAHTRDSGNYQEERFERNFLALLRNINRIIKTNSLIFCYTASQLELVFQRQSY